MNAAKKLEDLVKRYARTMPMEHAVRMAQKDMYGDAKTDAFGDRVRELRDSGKTHVEALTMTHAEFSGSRPRYDETDIEVRAKAYARDTAGIGPDGRSTQLSPEACRKLAMKDIEAEAKAGIVRDDPERRRMRDAIMEQEIKKGASRAAAERVALSVIPMSKGAGPMPGLYEAGKKSVSESRDPHNRGVAPVTNMLGNQIESDILDKHIEDGMRQGLPYAEAKRRGHMAIAEAAIVAEKRNADKRRGAA